MYRSPYLRNQTKNYVPEMCAAVLIGRNPDRYGFQAAPDAPFVYETVQVRSATKLGAIARAAGVSEAQIKDLNPQLLRGTTPPGAYEVRVPVGRGLEAQRKLGGRSASPAPAGRTYRIRKGDTLAKVARRFHVEPQDLLDANQIPASGFRAGRRIEIPPPGGVDEPAPRMREEEKPSAPEKPLEPIPAIPDGAGGEQAPRSAPAQGGVYRAVPGDTLAKIARAQGLSLGDLIRLNPEGARHLAVGDEVLFPESGARTAATQVPVRPRFHAVARGETLSAIASRYGLSVQELKRWNGLRSDRLRAGQRLRLAPR
jgi:membrane-bound lytic murein transglycosylase D